MPAAPANAHGDGRLVGADRLSWSASAGAATYRLERKGPNQSAFTEVARGLIGTSFQDSGVTPSSTYAYRVQAVNTVGTSAYGATDSATTPQVVTTGSLHRRRRRLA